MADRDRAADSTDRRTVPVQRIRSGQHAFAAYGGEAQQWPLLSAFVRQGLIEGEKVLVFLERGLTTEDLLSRLEEQRCDGHEWHTVVLAEAWERGQLELSSMRALIHPDRRFTAERQWHRLIEEADRAVREGYRAMRAYIDMAWVNDLGADIGEVMQRERSAEHLFTGQHYSEICAYDDRVFSPDVLRAMDEAHPVSVLGTIGTLHAVHEPDPRHTDTRQHADTQRHVDTPQTDPRGPDGEAAGEAGGGSGADDRDPPDGLSDVSPHGPPDNPPDGLRTVWTRTAGAVGAVGTAGPTVRLIGEADIATSAEFTRALHCALTRPTNGAPPEVTIDLTSLHFLGIGCAADLLRLSAQAATEHASSHPEPGKPGTAPLPGLPSPLDSSLQPYANGSGATPHSGAHADPCSGPHPDPRSDPRPNPSSGSSSGPHPEPRSGPSSGRDPGGRFRTTVRCTPIQARTLHHLGADSIRSLRIVVPDGAEEGNGC